jgi:CENP-B N-terminal DNA-binding domain
MSQKRVSLSLKEKVDIIRDIEANGNISAVSTRLNKSRTTVQTIWTKKEDTYIFSILIQKQVEILRNQEKLNFQKLTKHFMNGLRLKETEMFLLMVLFFWLKLIFFLQLIIN